MKRMSAKDKKGNKGIMSKKTIIVNAGDSAVASAYDDEGRLCFIINGKVFSAKEFRDFFDIISTVISFHPV